ncbi:MAG: hypothetical protein PVF91_02000 [Chromatiales bacterium]|jgi:hypothetical protein
MDRPVHALAGSLAFGAASVTGILSWLALGLLAVAVVIRLGALARRGRTIATALLDFGKGLWSPFEGSVVAVLLIAALLMLGTALGLQLFHEAPGPEVGPYAPGDAQVVPRAEGVGTEGNGK